MTTVKVLLFIGTNFHGFDKMRWSPSSWTLQTAINGF